MELLPRLGVTWAGAAALLEAFTLLAQPWKLEISFKSFGTGCLNMLCKRQLTCIQRIYLSLKVEAEAYHAAIAKLAKVSKSR